MAAIWRFTLNLTRNTLEIPKGAKAISVNARYGKICLWMEVDKTQPLEKREFIVVKTGQDLPDDEKQFIGTVLVDSAATGLHVYEVFDCRVPPLDRCLVCGEVVDELSDDVFHAADGMIHFDCTESIGDSLNDEQRICGAIELATRFGQNDEAHHKAWVIDQMLRVLAGSEYETLIKDAKDGEDGPNTYAWDEGIAP